jgi:uncharacterized RDD family membrane protein YckC
MPPAPQPDLPAPDLLASVPEDDPPAGEEPVSEPPVETAVFGARLLAGAIDLLLLLAIDALVIYFTLRISGLDPAEARILPIVPLTAFFLLLNGGYFFTLTAAGGQTLGKMAAGVRVVAETGDPIPVAAAAVRTAAYLVSVLPAGLGLLFVVTGGDGRALHDRLAHTRVVKAHA